MILHLAAILWVLPGCLAVWAGGQHPDHEASVRTGQEVLRAQPDVPWYDPDRDTIRRIHVEPDPDDQHRQSRWASEKVQREESPETRRPSFFWQLMQVLAWILLAALLVALMWFLVWAAHRLDVGGFTAGKTLERATVGPERMEELPMAIPPTDQDLLAAARACYEAGDYGMAIIYAYAYQLMELDHHHAIQLRKGKTNRQYLRELHARPRLRELLRDTMLAFEAVFFGHHVLSRPQFEQCWNSLDEFHRQLEQLA